MIILDKKKGEGLRECKRTLGKTYKKNKNCISILLFCIRDKNSE
jgi:hypothetical protein